MTVSVGRTTPLRLMIESDLVCGRVGRGLPSPSGSSAIKSNEAASKEGLPRFGGGTFMVVDSPGGRFSSSEMVRCLRMGFFPEAFSRLYRST